MIFNIVAGLIVALGVVLIVRPQWKKHIFAFFPLLLLALGSFFLFWGKDKNTKNKEKILKDPEKVKFNPKKGRKIDEKITEIETKVFLDSVPEGSSIDDHIDFLRKHYSDSPDPK